MNEMSFSPLLSAGPEVQIHAFAALAAILLSILQFSLAKGTGLHRTLGYIWASLMMLIALSSFWIHTIRLWGPFSPIHILSVITLIGVPSAIYAARKGNVAKHKYAMIQLTGLALLGAGLFAALMPNRVMYHVLIGS